MTRVTNSDQILILLRQQLQRMSGRSQTRKAARTDGNRGSEQSGVARLRALAQLDDLTSDDFERALIQGLLIEEFGEGFVNDPRFQKLVDQVLGIIASDQQSRKLLQGAKRELLR